MVRFCFFQRSKGGFCPICNVEWAASWVQTKASHADSFFLFSRNSTVLCGWWSNFSVWRPIILGNPTRCSPLQLHAAGNSLGRLYKELASISRWTGLFRVVIWKDLRRVKHVHSNPEERSNSIWAKWIKWMALVRVGECCQLAQIVWFAICLTKQLIIVPVPGYRTGRPGRLKRFTSNRGWVGRCWKWILVSVAKTEWMWKVWVPGVVKGHVFGKYSVKGTQILPSVPASLILLILLCVPHVVETFFNLSR